MAEISGTGMPPKNVSKEEESIEHRGSMLLNRITHPMMNKTIGKKKKKKDHWDFSDKLGAEAHQAQTWFP